VFLGATGFVSSDKQKIGAFYQKINHSMLSHRQNKLHYDSKVAEQAAYRDSTLYHRKLYSTS